jgi:hypothetical protein
MTAQASIDDKARPVRQPRFICRCANGGLCKCTVYAVHFYITGTSRGLTILTPCIPPSTGRSTLTVGKTFPEEMNSSFGHLKVTRGKRIIAVFLLIGTPTPEHIFGTPVYHWPPWSWFSRQKTTINQKQILSRKKKREYKKKLFSFLYIFLSTAVLRFLRWIGNKRTATLIHFCQLKQK